MTPIAPVLSTEVEPVTCPLCHTADRTVTPATLAAGARWGCATCGQTWSATRLAASAAYARHVAAG